MIIVAKGAISSFQTLTGGKDIHNTCSITSAAFSNNLKVNSFINF